MNLSYFTRYRRLLFLQGPIGPFFARLQHALERQGSSCHAVNLNAGDWLFRPTGTNYKGSLADWSPWLEAHLQEVQPQAILLFGDCRVYHKAAVQLAKKLGIAVYVFEEGYFRPNLITVERGGVNGYSSLPRNAEFYQHTHTEAPSLNKFKVAFSWTVLVAALYYAAAFLSSPFWPNYQHHRDLNAVRECWRWLKGAARNFVDDMTGRTSRIVQACRRQLHHKYFLVPLQLAVDFQIREHSSMDIPEFLDTVLRSFASNAPKDNVLVIKQHPYDLGHNDYTRLIKSMAMVHGISDRVLYLRAGHMPTLLKHARGTVVLNSTSGLASLYHGVPTKTLATAIYDIPGLTAQEPLDQFWQSPSPVDSHLFTRYRRFVIGRTQVNAHFLAPLPSLAHAPARATRTPSRQPYGPTR